MQSIIANNGRLDHVDFARRLKRWAEDGLPKFDNKRPCGIGKTVSMVLGDADFLQDPHRAAWNVWEQLGCSFAANGAVMRSAVLGCVEFGDEDVVARNAINAGLCTHADPRCLVSCVVVNVLIARMLKGDNEFRITDPNKESPRSELLSLVNKTYREEKAAERNNEPKQRPRFRIDDAAKKRLMSAIMGEKTDTPAPATFSMSDGIDPLVTSLPASSMPRVVVTEDPVYGGLCQNVLNKYSYLLTSAHQPNAKPSLLPFMPFNPASAHAELVSFTTVPSLTALQLDQAIGYTYKTLGAGLYLLTRDISSFSSPSEAFKTLITELILEGGDADTNAAVAGALLGCRIGFEGLPKEWVVGLRHRERLGEVVEEFCSVIGV